jgi:hypothetical protein
MSAERPLPDDQIAELWFALFGEPPPIRASVEMMIEALVGGLRDPEIGDPWPGRAR